MSYKIKNWWYLFCDGKNEDDNDDDKMKFKNWDRAGPIGPDTLEVYAWSCFLGGVAPPVSIKARSRLSLDSAVEQY